MTEGDGPLNYGLWTMDYRLSTVDYAKRVNLEYAIKAN
jgi:hypothetical protein